MLTFVLIDLAVGQIILQNVEHTGELREEKNLVLFGVQMREKMIEDVKFTTGLHCKVEVTSAA